LRANNLIFIAKIAKIVLRAPRLSAGFGELLGPNPGVSINSSSAGRGKAE
jgi:hypothetical protein